MFSAYFHTLFRKYASTRGRASRREYWIFLCLSPLFIILLSLFTIAPFVLIGHALADFLADSFFSFILLPLSLILLFALLMLLFMFILPWSALCVRRLHDINLPGWLILCMCIPGCCTITTIALGLIPGTDYANNYGTR